MAACFAILVLAAIAAACSAVGVLAARLAGDESSTSPCGMGVGLAGLLAVGGVLNVFGFATRPILMVLLIAGAFVGVAITWRRRRIHQPSREVWIPLAIVALAMGFAVFTQLRPRVFNYHDDFQKYFVHPVRMLETGTVAGGPVSAVGSETLGGQAFLQGILTALVPIEYINAVDGVLGLFLCLALARQLAVSLRGTILSIATVLLINPQYVNISSLYLLAALVMTATHLGFCASPHPVVLALLYAGMLALKTTAAPFVIAHAVVVVAAVWVGGRRPIGRFCGSLIVATLLFTLPWFLVQVDSWARPWSTLPGVGVYANHMDIFSGEKLFYGASMALYTCLVCALVLALILRVVGSARPWTGREVYAAGLGALLIGLYYTFSFGFGKLYGNWAAVRYFTPFGIGLTPAIVAELTRAWTQRWAALAAVGAVGVSLIGFIPDCGTRLLRVFRQGSALSFASAADADYQHYSDYVLSDRARNVIAAAQDCIPPGEPVLVWLDFPFYLNFARNPVFDIDTAGLATPWARLPDVRYVIWARKGYATLPASYYERRRSGPGLRERLIAIRTLDAMRSLSRVVAPGRLLWEQDGVAVYQVSGLGGAF